MNIFNNSYNLEKLRKKKYEENRLLFWVFREKFQKHSIHNNGESLGRSIDREVRQ